MKRFWAAALVLCLLLSGCAEPKKQQQANGIYPLQTEQELTHWMELNNDARYSVEKFGDTAFAKELELETGVKVKYISPVEGQGSEALNLMIASRELPDLISYPWFYYPGGPERAMMENVLQPLTETIPKYSPNLNQYLEEHPDVKKMVTTDKGEYTVYPFIRDDESLTVYFGPMVRRDLLDSTGRDSLETVEDWHAFLTDMKQRGFEKPLTFPMPALESGFLSGAFGVVRTSYVENGIVKFGAVEPGYRDYLQTMRQWYQEGLLDKDFMASDNKVYQNMLDGSSAATVGYAGSSMGYLLKELQQIDSSYDLVAVPNPVLNRGETPKFIKKDFLYTPANSVGITSQCRNMELAAKYLDYGYTAAGRNLFNYGIEGESYRMEGGQPVYTEKVINNSNGLSTSQALAYYTKNYSGPFIQEKRYAELYYTYDQQKQAVKTWAKSDVDQYLLPLISVREDEYDEYSRIYSAVISYVDETLAEFVMGVRSLDSFDEYVEGMRQLGLDRMLEIQQAAYERYNQK